MKATDKQGKKNGNTNRKYNLNNKTSQVTLDKNQ